MPAVEACVRAVGAEEGKGGNTGPAVPTGEPLVAVVGVALEAAAGVAACHTCVVYRTAVAAVAGDSGTAGHESTPAASASVHASACA